MKKALLFLCLFCSGNLLAQPWQPKGTGPQKLEDIIAAWQRAEKKDRDEEAREKTVGGKQLVEEDGDYHFDRWAWYMSRHTDEQGYLVSPLATWQAWEKYRAKAAVLSAAKTTGASQANWTAAGPFTTFSGYNGIGRMNVVAFHPADTNTYWVGSAGGGAWKTVNDGQSWTPMTDNLPVLGVSDIGINPANPNTIYLCTGDRDASDTYSIGVLKSTDGGATWALTGLQWTTSQLNLANSLVINRLDTNSLTLAASNGIYKSYNGGTTWTNVLAGNYKQVLYHPTDTNVLYATSTASGIASGQILRSANGGATWTTVTSLSNVRRITLAVTPANPRIVKAVAASTNNFKLEGIYSSSDTGHSFVKIMSDSSCTRNILSGEMQLSATSCSGQGWYDLSIAISPTDSNKVYVGGVNTYASANGGKNWQIVTQWYSNLPGVMTVHADKHFLAFNPARPQVLFECNDGGLYRTLSPASQLWNDLSDGLVTTQFYRNAVTGNAGFVLGGSQDNGTKQIDYNTNYTQHTGGDGMNCEIDANYPFVFYTSSQYGKLYATQDGGVNFDVISDNIPGNPTGSWITPYILHPLQQEMLIAGYEQLYISTDLGNSWNNYSPVFSNGTKITRIAASPQTFNYLYALLPPNDIRYTTNNGGTWQQLNVTSGGTVSDITVDPLDSTHLWATFGGYGNTRVAHYKPAAGWQNLSNGLPNIPVNCILIDSTTFTKYVGTDIGVFFMDTTMTSWAAYNTNLPAVEVMDLGIDYTQKEIWAATYGRGMWRSRKADTIPDRSGIDPLQAKAQLSVYPNPASDKVTVTATGSQWAGQPVHLALYDASGRVARQSEARFDGSGRLETDVKGLAKGNYFLYIRSAAGTAGRARLLVE